METKKRHEILTIAELKELVTTENVERLSYDLSLWLRFIAGVKAELPNLGSKVELSPSFVWIDDGQHDTHVSMVFKKKTE